ncbi:cytochrome c oxidase assembly factor 7 homolog [Leptidea sinapis]|uniref:cytochrome c oxidase assembly factor 7 homolog n=1 Tax=Leptidea sinapis TaxID=189913 RepID=UPI002120F5DB|nr:cytochrome c oxidase assembly factor 7 homolog [Leptidea sinapis]
MAYDLQKEEEVKEFVENLGIEYRFGCYKEKKPEVCHLLGDYLEAIKKDFSKAGKVFKNNCLEYKYGKSCLKIGNYNLIGKGLDKSDTQEALKYFEKGCELNEPTACLHAGLLLTGSGPDSKIDRNVPKGYDYLTKSCEGKDANACHYLAGMYLSGVPKNPKEFNPHKPEKNKNIEYLIKQDYMKAFEFAKSGCELGNMYACANVSIMYKKGDGVEKNLELSKKYFEIAQNLHKAHELTKELKFQQGLDEDKK